jgi:hypothetical protein
MQKGLSRFVPVCMEKWQKSSQGAFMETDRRQKTVNSAQAIVEELDLEIASLKEELKIKKQDRQHWEGVRKKVVRALNGKKGEK